MRPIGRSPVAVLVLMGTLAGCAAPADSITTPASPTAQGSASPGPTGAATVEPRSSPGLPTPTATPGPGSGDLVVPGFATVTADRLLMRRDPGLEGEPLTTADGCIDNPDPNCERPLVIGTESGYVELYVFDGPIQADGYAWYLSATEMHTEERASLFPEGVGWVAAGDDADAWLVPASRRCPADPIALADLTLAAMTRLEALFCFGAEALTLRGWYPDLPPGETESTYDLDACREERIWVACYSIFDMLRPEQADWAGDADYLGFTVDPSSDVSMPARSQWVEVTGAFDHPASERCGDVAEVLICRSTFVVSSAAVP